MGKSQITLSLAGWMNGKAGVGAWQPQRLIPWKIPRGMLRASSSQSQLQARNDQPLDFACAFVNLGDLRIPEVALHRVFL